MQVSEKVTIIEFCAFFVAPCFSKCNEPRHTNCFLDFNIKFTKILYGQKSHSTNKDVYKGAPKRTLGGVFKGSIGLAWTEHGLLRHYAHQSVI